MYQIICVPKLSAALRRLLFVSPYPFASSFSPLDGSSLESPLALAGSITWSPRGPHFGFFGGGYPEGVRWYNNGSGPSVCTKKLVMLITIVDQNCSSNFVPPVKFFRNVFSII